jgi:hypothetical protein
MASQWARLWRRKSSRCEPPAARPRRSSRHTRPVLNRVTGFQRRQSFGPRWILGGAGCGRFSFEKGRSFDQGLLLLWTARSTFATSTRSRRSGSATSKHAHAGSDKSGTFWDFDQPTELESRRTSSGHRAWSDALTECTSVGSSESRGGRRVHCRMGCQVHIQSVAPSDGHPRNKHHRQPRHNCGSRMDTTARHASISRLHRRPRNLRQSGGGGARGSIRQASRRRHEADERQRTWCYRDLLHIRRYCRGCSRCSRPGRYSLANFMLARTARRPTNWRLRSS